MYCVHTRTKEPQEPPEHTSEHVKSLSFLEVCPQTPTIYFTGPHLLYLPWAPQTPNPLGGLALSDYCTI